MNECVLDMVELSSDTLFLELVFLCPNILQASIKVIFELYKVILKPFFLKKKRWNITDPSSSRKDGVVSLYPDPPTYN